MTVAPELVEFRPDEAGAVVAAMAAMHAAHEGWINVQPAVNEDDLPAPGSPLFGIFSGSGPAVPLITWAPGEKRRRGFGRSTVGVQHGSGPKAADRLRESGRPLPEGWVVVQDHPKRGLVAAVPPDADDADVLAWLIDAATALSRVPFTGTWRAAIYHP